MVMRLYEDMIAGRISEQNFNTMLEKTQTEQTAVSYTHLDVYKRQSMSFPFTSMTGGVSLTTNYAENASMGAGRASGRLWLTALIIYPNEPRKRRNTQNEFWIYDDRHTIAALYALSQSVNRISSQQHRKGYVLPLSLIHIYSNYYWVDDDGVYMSQYDTTTPDRKYRVVENYKTENAYQGYSGYVFSHWRNIIPFGPLFRYVN